MKRTEYEKLQQKRKDRERKVDAVIMLFIIIAMMACVIGEAVIRNSK